LLPLGGCKLPHLPQDLDSRQGRVQLTSGRGHARDAVASCAGVAWHKRHHCVMVGQIRDNRDHVAGILAGVSSVGVAGLVVLYTALIRAQGGPPPDTPLTVPFVASYLVAMALLLATSLIVPFRIRPLLRAAPAAGLVVLGVLAAFSIGLPIVGLGILAASSAGLSIRAEPSGASLAAAAAVGLASIAVLIIGLQIASTYIVCSPGVSSGGTAGLFGPSSYRCDYGHLVKL
jgi:hypothetical protein